MADAEVELLFARQQDAEAAIDGINQRNLSRTRLDRKSLEQRTRLSIKVDSGVPGEVISAVLEAAGDPANLSPGQIVVTQTQQVV